KRRPTPRRLRGKGEGRGRRLIASTHAIDALRCEAMRKSGRARAGTARDNVPRDGESGTHPTAAPAASAAAAAVGREAARDPLLAAICHDLRAPLAAVTMGANFVLQTVPEEDPASGRSRRVLQAILRSCKQMERIVRDFGDLSEIEGHALAL